MDLYEAIIKRKTVRKFEDRILPKEVIGDIVAYADTVERLYDNIDINIEVVAGSKKAKAPHYITIYSEEKEGYGENAGYVMQYMVMYLVSMGLGCCYQGSSGYAAKRDAKGRKKVIVVAFGYADEECFRESIEASRHTQQDICTFKDTPNVNIDKLIEAVRMAPSSFNSQPWRMLVYKDSLHLFMKKAHLPVTAHYNHINIGIARANIDMTADSQWIDIVSKQIPSFKDKKYNNLEYVISIKNVIDNNMM